MVDEVPSSVSVSADFKKYLNPEPKMPSTSEHSLVMDKELITKRVLAPYVNMVRKGHKVTLRRTAEKLFSFFLAKKPSALVKNLSEMLGVDGDLPALLNETSEALRAMIEASGSRFYMVNSCSTEIYQYQNNTSNPRLKVSYKIEDGKSVAAYVANHKEYVLCEDILLDNRFPDGVSYKDTAKSVLSVPILSKSEKCYGVLEFYRTLNLPAFTKENLKIVVLVACWVGAAINQNQEGVALHMKQDINDYLLELVRAYFGKALTLEKMICEVVGYSKLKLKAEKGAFYIVEKVGGEFLADVYEEGIAEVVAETILVRKNVRVPFAKDKSVAAMVAHTRELLNVRDVYNDPRFTKEIERSHIHRTELCMPIVGHEGILGIITVINKMDGKSFNEIDEELIGVVASYCAMALHFAKLNNANKRLENELLYSTNLLNFHMKPCAHSINIFETTLSFNDKTIEIISDFDYYYMNDEITKMPMTVYRMFAHVIGVEYINQTDMMCYILSAQKAYRDTIYHNFFHAFTVTHCMYLIILNNRDIFSQIEVQALMVAALGHDLDHLGFNNNYLALTNNVLYQLYPDSTLEHHHFDMTMLILSTLTIFNNLDEPETYALFTSIVKSSILATDLCSYFKTRAKIIPLINEEAFDWQDPQHRLLGIGMIIVTCDVSGMCKPFSIAKQIIDDLYREFYKQGDKEKSLGLMPLTMMDRDSQHQVPDDQYQFMSVVVIPLCQVTALLLPTTSTLLQHAVLLRDTWKQIIESRGQKLWRQDESV